MTGRSPRLPVRDAVRIGAVGSLLAIHWVLFYGSIKASNVSIGVVSFSTIGFFSALLEPWFERSRPRWTNLGLSLLSLAGVALIFHFDFRYRTGILLGVACAVFAALFTILAAGLVVPALPWLLAFAAGAMLYVVVEELIPEMAEGEHSDAGPLAFALGFTLMMVLDVALG